ncbi:MAG: COG4315 family predicted lipoprotein [Acidimicrobiales bacterium]
MEPSWSTRTGSARKWVAAASLAGAAVLALGACGSSTAKTTTPGAGATSSMSSSSVAGAASAYTISAAKVSGVGTVLVDGKGRTLYLLSSEKGGHITCTASNGCTTYWPPVVLPSGASHGVAGSGIDASKLGTATDSTGAIHVTYGGWPLYEYAGDSGPGSAKGQGVNSFGGTWAAVTPSGTPATASSGSSTPSTTAHAPIYGGY